MSDLLADLRSALHQLPEGRAAVLGRAFYVKAHSSPIEESPVWTALGEIVLHMVAEDTAALLAAAEVFDDGEAGEIIDFNPWE